MSSESSPSPSLPTLTLNVIEIPDEAAVRLGTVARLSILGNSNVDPFASSYTINVGGYGECNYYDPGVPKARLRMSFPATSIQGQARGTAARHSQSRSFQVLVFPSEASGRQ